MLILLLSVLVDQQITIPLLAMVAIVFYQEQELQQLLLLEVVLERA